MTCSSDLEGRFYVQYVVQLEVEVTRSTLEVHNMVTARKLRIPAWITRGAGRQMVGGEIFHYL
jgi:hypothetical protein